MYGCKQVIALALHRLGKSEEAARLDSDELPSFWASRELLYPRVAPPDKAEKQRRFNLIWLAEQLRLTLNTLSRTPSQNEAYTLLEQAIHLLRE